MPFFETILDGLKQAVGINDSPAQPVKVRVRAQVEEQPTSSPSMETFNSASKLSKEATAKAKAGDYEAAVELQRQAADKDPMDLSRRYKLARYLRKAGRGDDAWALYGEMTRKIGANPTIASTFELSKINEERAKQVYEEGKYPYYLSSMFRSFWCRFTAVAAQGRHESNPDYNMSDFFPASKLKKCLKALGVDVEEFKHKANEHYRSEESKLIELSELAKRKARDAFSASVARGERSDVKGYAPMCGHDCYPNMDEEHRALFNQVFILTYTDLYSLLVVPLLPEDEV